MSFLSLGFSDISKQCFGPGFLQCCSGLSFDSQRLVFSCFVDNSVLIGKANLSLHRVGAL